MSGDDLRDLVAILADDALLDALGRENLTDTQVRARFGAEPVIEALLRLREENSGAVAVEDLELGAAAAGPDGTPLGAIEGRGHSGRQDESGTAGGHDDAVGDGRG